MKKAMRKALPWLIAVIAIAALAAALDGFMSIYTMKAVDAVFTGNRESFAGIVKKMFGMALCLIPTTLILAYFRGMFKRKAAISAKSNFIERLFRKNINEFQADNNSKYVSVLTNDFNTIESNYIDGIFTSVINILNFIVAVLVIGAVSPLALGSAVIVGLISALASSLISKPLQKHQAHRSELYSDYTAYIKEVLGAFHIIKSNNLSDKVKEDYRNKSEKIQYKGYVIDKITTYIISLNRVNFSFAFIGLMGVSVWMGIKGIITVGGVILIITHMEKIMQPISELGEWLPKIFGTKKLFQKIEDTLKNIDSHEESIVVEGIRERIAFEGVSFGFEDNEVLKNINLKIEKGGKYLVVGPSGGGKSTLLRLLRKYYSPQAGRILMDGDDLRDVTKDSFFKHIANVEQQVFLFEDTVRNNLALYKDYPDDMLWMAIDRAGLLQFVKNLPMGLDSMIYDNGKNISGGERSRLAIARALLAKAQIIFLDEAFSSLDAETAQAIERTLLELRGITVINVSHVTFESSRHLYTNVLTVKNRGILVA